jgi:hypothetical protein
MSVDLSKLSPAELKAAMTGGTEGWGQRASIADHVIYVKTCLPTRRKCRCGCNRRKTHGLYANGIIMASGCELSMRREAKALPHPSGTRP